jgi:hypothetical protein
VVLVNTATRSVTLGDLAAEYLIGSGRKSVLIFLPESQQERMAKRPRVHEVSYEGSLPGRCASRVLSQIRVLPCMQLCTLLWCLPSALLRLTPHSLPLCAAAESTSFRRSGLHRPASSSAPRR